jgi:hypothetical protein
MAAPVKEDPENAAAGATMVRTIREQVFMIKLSFAEEESFYDLRKR